MSYRRYAVHFLGSAELTETTQFEAYEAFLEHFPEWVGNVVLIQVTTPTANDSPVVARKISRLVDHINVS